MKPDRCRRLGELLEAETRLLGRIAWTLEAGLPVDRERFADVLVNVNAARRLLGLKLTRWPVRSGASTDKRNPTAPEGESPCPQPRI